MTTPVSGAPPLRILMVGELDPLLTTGARFAAFRELGVEVEGVDSRRHLAGKGPWAKRLTHWTLRTPEVYAFNRALLDFLTAVDAGRWPRRDPASKSASAILPVGGPDVAPHAPPGGSARAGGAGAPLDTRPGSRSR